MVKANLTVVFWWDLVHKWWYDRTHYQFHQQFQHAWCHGILVTSHSIFAFRIPIIESNIIESKQFLFLVMEKRYSEQSISYRLYHIRWMLLGDSCLPFLIKLLYYFTWWLRYKIDNCRTVGCCFGLQIIGRWIMVAKL